MVLYNIFIICLLSLKPAYVPKSLGRIWIYQNQHPVCKCSVLSKNLNCGLSNMVIPLAPLKFYWGEMTRTTKEEMVDWRWLCKSKANDSFRIKSWQIGQLFLILLWTKRGTCDHLQGLRTVVADEEIIIWSPAGLELWEMKKSESVDSKGH